MPAPLSTFVLAALAGLLAPALAAQSVLAPADLDFYRVQAFNSESAGRRLPLNHIGIAGVTATDGFLVTAVLDGYPAHGAGILRGDLLLRAGGERFHPVFAFNDPARAPDRFQPQPRAVDIELLRNGNRRTLRVTPVFENLFDSYRTAQLASVQQFPSGNKTVGYLRPWVLSRATTDLIAYQRLFDRLDLSDGLILDLRAAGGFLDSRHLDLVYRGGQTPLVVENPSSVFHDASSPGWPLAGRVYRNPVAILIDEHTEGGAEILAGQLGKLSRVVTVGAGTAGRIGDYRLSGSGAGMEYHYEPANGVLVDGVEFEDTGYSPEETVPYPVEQQGRIDPQFQAAFDILMGII